MRNFAVTWGLLFAPMTLAAPSLPDGPTPIPLPPTGQAVFPATVSQEGLFEPVSLIHWGLELSDLESLSDGDSDTSPEWTTSIIRARLGLESERENVTYRVLGEFKRDLGTSVWEAESGDTLELPDEVSGWRYQLRDAFVELGGGGLRVGLTSSGLGFAEGGATGIQGHSYQSLGAWSALFENRFYSVRGSTELFGNEMSLIGGQGQSGKTMAAGSLQVGVGSWGAGVAGGLYDDSVLASGWGSAELGAMTVQAEVLYVGEIAWQAGASYLRSLESEMFSGLKLLAQTRYRGSGGDLSPGLEATGGVVLIHRVDEDLDLTSGLSWSVIIPDSELDALNHSAVLDLQLVY